LYWRGAQATTALGGWKGSSFRFLDDRSIKSKVLKVSNYVDIISCVGERRGGRRKGGGGAWENKLVGKEGV